MDAIGTAERGAAWMRSLAKDLTTTLEDARDQLTSYADDANRRATDALERMKEAGEDAIAYLNPGPWLEDVYALLGIASASAMADLDERIDYVEIKVEEVARKRAREELLLLQQRIGELENVLSQIGDGQRPEVMGGLLLRLAELESRIDSFAVGSFRRGTKVANVS
jgi:hypothetical protein